MQRVFSVRPAAINELALHGKKVVRIRVLASHPFVYVCVPENKEDPYLIVEKLNHPVGFSHDEIRLSPMAGFKLLTLCESPEKPIIQESSLVLDNEIDWVIEQYVGSDVIMAKPAFPRALEGKALPPWISEEVTGNVRFSLRYLFFNLWASK